MIQLDVSSESGYDYAFISQLDNASAAYQSGYYSGSRISGENSVTVTIPVTGSGSHFIDIGIEKTHRPVPVPIARGLRVSNRRDGITPMRAAVLYGARTANALYRPRRFRVDGVACPALRFQLRAQQEASRPAQRASGGVIRQKKWNRLFHVSEGFRLIF
jgi:hypothetical protein